MTVTRLLDEITTDELTYWMAFFKLEQEDYEHKKMTNEIESKVKR